jgi:predicted nucleic acid-binding protein
VTHEILLEYEEIMGEKYGENTAKLFLILLGELPNVEFIRTFFKFSLIEKDPDDNKFIDATFASSAKFLVSEDRHFRILKKINFPKIEVIGIDMFLELLKKV